MKMGCCGSRKHNWKAVSVGTKNSDQDSDPNDETAPVTETGTRLWDPMGSALGKGAGPLQSRLALGHFHSDLKLDYGLSAQHPLKRRSGRVDESVSEAMEPTAVESADHRGHPHFSLLNRCLS